MTLYYTLVFALLLGEMIVFALLILPIPFKLRLKLYTFISESVWVAKIQYALKITFIFILVLFLDSVNRVYRVQLELHAASESANHGRASVLGSDRLEVQARKFYSQRNMYLCGFTLFLSIILNRTYNMIMENLVLESKIKKLETDAAAKAKDAKKPDQEHLKEIDDLKWKLEQRELDLENLKKQGENLGREYIELTDKYAATQEKDDTPKKDK